jgi:hypothetical protein
VLWLHCECGGCCHHFDVGLQGTSCPLAEGYCEYQGLCCGCTVNVVVAVMICVRLQGTRSPIFMVSLYKW